MTQTNPPQVSESYLNQPSSLTEHSRKPNWQIGAVLSEAWVLSNGFKASFWGAFLLYLVVAVGVAMVMGVGTLVITMISSDAAMVASLLAQVIQLAITIPLMTGLLMLGIKRAAGQPVNVAMVFSYFPKTLPLFFLYLMMMILIIIGFVLLVVPGIYFLVAYALALPLLVDKNLSIWQALETSRKGITACWFRFFCLGMIIFMIVLVSAIPLGIGLIWTLPWCHSVIGVVYRDIFGVSSI